MQYKGFIFSNWCFNANEVDLMDGNEMISNAFMHGLPLRLLLCKIENYSSLLSHYKPTAGQFNPYLLNTD